MMKFLKGYWRDQRGATSIEYGLIATLICSAVIAAMTNYGNNLANTWNKVSSKMS
jgi:pilus assembly protein Flp/PilA